MVRGPGVTGIDMPLGFAAAKGAAEEGEGRRAGGGWRRCDGLARALLGPRRSSVFAIPPRQVWSCGSYQEANRLCRQLTAQGLSAQAWGLRVKLLEANEHRSRLKLLEVHPELSFTAMAGAPLPVSKHVPAGRELRLSLLESAGISLPAGARDTDTIDAAAVAWSAARISGGTAVTLPDPPDRDSGGLEIAIRY